MAQVESGRLPESLAECRPTFCQLAASGGNGRTERRVTDIVKYAMKRKIYPTGWCYFINRYIFAEDVCVIILSEHMFVCARSGPAVVVVSVANNSKFIAFMSANAHT